jgi:hypothetical protein
MSGAERSFWRRERTDSRGWGQAAFRRSEPFEAMSNFGERTRLDPISRKRCVLRASPDLLLCVILLEVQRLFLSSSHTDSERDIRQQQIASKNIE